MNQILEAFALVLVFVMILLIASVPELINHSGTDTVQALTKVQQAFETGELNITVLVTVTVALVTIIATTKSR